MKNSLLIAALLFVTAVPALADESRDALYRAQAERDLLKLDFTCAEDFAQTSLDDLPETLKSASGESTLSDIDIACRMKTLVKAAILAEIMPFSCALTISWPHPPL